MICPPCSEETRPDAIVKLEDLDAEVEEEERDSIPFPLRRVTFCRKFLIAVVLRVEKKRTAEIYCGERLLGRGHLQASCDKQSQERRIERH